MINKSKITSLQILLASSEKIRSWSHGEIKNSETINYKSNKPEKDGLFDEVIFGPVKDYECSCGKYKKVKYKGKVCERCGVEVIESIVRRERMGHIELVVPVAHIWMSKELPNPSKISLILGMSYKEVEQIIYFVNYVVLDNSGDKNLSIKDVINLTDRKENRKYRGVLRQILSDISNKLDKSSLDFRIANDFYDRLKDTNLPFSIGDVFKFIKKHTGIKIGIGAEAILELLSKVDLKQEAKNIQEKLKHLQIEDQQFKKLMKRLETIQWFIESKIDPKWMILNVVPVTPPDTRPIIRLSNGRYTTSDINNLYRKILIRNGRLKKMIEINAPDIIINNEKRLLQESVDVLFDNASKAKPALAKDKRPLKSLTDHLKGKQGLFRQNLLGKRVDYSGRSVIVVGPELKMYEVGIPSLMLLQLFKPFIIHELIKKYDENHMEIKPIASNIKVAEKMILKQENVIWPILQKVIKQRPVLMNRAPTLHRLGIQAFEPKMIDGKAIRLHPLVTTAFNADFDGDQMAIHIPLSSEAINEARAILLGSWHVLGPKDGKPIITPTQDMILGIYYLSSEKKRSEGEGMIFNNSQEVVRAFVNGLVTPHTIIGISTQNYQKKFPNHPGVLITTVGKIFINNVLPPSATYLNDPNSIDQFPLNDIVGHGENPKEAIEKHVERSPFTKKTLSQIITMLFDNFSIEEVSKTMDAIKNLGFRYSTKSGITVSAYDIPEYKQKKQYFEKADMKVNKLRELYFRGLLTDDERYKKTVEVWSKVKDEVTKDVVEVMNDKKYRDNSIIIMSKSGARGNVSQFTQLFGMRGLMWRSYNYDQKPKDSSIVKDIIEVPIKNSFKEGLTIQEYFNSSFGARKAMADTSMRTPQTGWMTRKLVDAAQEIIVTTHDCGTKQGITIKALYNDSDGSLIETLADRVVNRTALFDINNPKNGTLIVKANDIITQAAANEIEKSGIHQVEVRSILQCNAINGVCQKCFGNDLSNMKFVEIGTPIGVIAAQSIGEPGTQLTMRTFHTGGAASSTGNITEGAERLRQIFDVVPPKKWERAIISTTNGTVKTIEQTNTGYKIEILNELINDNISIDVPLGMPLKVKVGSLIKVGDRLNDGLIDINELLKLKGVDETREYILKEVQKIYRLQGIEISDKYIEIIIYQMTNKFKVLNPGDSDFFIGQIVDNKILKQENKKLLVNNQNPITAINMVYSIVDAPAKADSFLSAASFQDTKKILTDACVRGQTDRLKTLKENVMLGNLIPVGFGLVNKDEVNQKGVEMYQKEY